MVVFRINNRPECDVHRNNSKQSTADTSRYTDTNNKAKIASNEEILPAASSSSTNQYSEYQSITMVLDYMFQVIQLKMIFLLPNRLLIKSLKLSRANTDVYATSRGACPYATPMFEGG